MAFASVESQAQAVWTAKTLEQKQIAFKDLLNASRITAEKKAQYLVNLPKWTLAQIDKTAANFMLFDKDSVIK